MARHQTRDPRAETYALRPRSWMRCDLAKSIWNGLGFRTSPRFNIPAKRASCPGAKFAFVLPPQPHWQRLEPFDFTAGFGAFAAFVTDFGAGTFAFAAFESFSPFGVTGWPFG